MQTADACCTSKGVMTSGPKEKMSRVLNGSKAMYGLETIKPTIFKARVLASCSKPYHDIDRDERLYVSFLGNKCLIQDLIFALGLGFE